MVVNLSQTCRKCRRDRGKVCLDNTCDTFVTIWKLRFIKLAVMTLLLLYFPVVAKRFFL